LESWTWYQSPLWPRTYIVDPGEATAETVYDLPGPVRTLRPEVAETTAVVAPAGAFTVVGALFVGAVAVDGGVVGTTGLTEDPVQGRFAPM
jgi:hypothetical protein